MSLLSVGTKACVPISEHLSLIKFVRERTCNDLQHGITTLAWYCSAVFAADERSAWLHALFPRTTAAVNNIITTVMSLMGDMMISMVLWSNVE